MYQIRSRIMRPVPDSERLKTLPNILDKITGFVLGRKTGLANLKSLVVTTKWLKKSALKDCVMRNLNLKTYVQCGFWTQFYNHYHPLFLLLLRARHPDAVYLEAIRLAFNTSEVDAALILLETIKEVHDHANVLFFVLNQFVGDRYEDFFLKEMAFWKKFYYGAMGMWEIGAEIKMHVGGVYPKDVGTFRKTFKDWGNGEVSPGCDVPHPRSMWRLKLPGDICTLCVLHWLARDLLDMS